MARLRERLRRAREGLARANTVRKEREMAKISVQTIREKERIRALEKKREFQKLKERRRALEKETRTGITGFFAGLESKRISPSEERARNKKRMKARLATYEIAGITSPKGLLKPKTKRKRKAKKAKVATRGRAITIRF